MYMMTLYHICRVQSIFLLLLRHVAKYIPVKFLLFQTHLFADTGAIAQKRYHLYLFDIYYLS